MSLLFAPGEDPRIKQVVRKAAIPADAIQATDKLRNDIAQKFEIQSLVYEFLQVVGVLQSSVLSAGNGSRPSEHVWDTDLLKKLLQIDQLDGDSKVLQISNGPGNNAADFGLKPNNLYSHTGDLRAPQATLDLPYRNDTFDEVWNTQGVFADFAISGDAKKLLQKCSFVIPPSAGAWSPIHLSSNLYKLFAVMQLEELLRVTKPGGHIRFAGSKEYLKKSEISALFETDHYAICTDERGDIDLIAMGAPNAAILNQLVELPDIKGLQDENDTSNLGGYKLRKRPEFNHSLMLEFLAKRYRDLFPPNFFQHLQAAQNLDMN